VQATQWRCLLSPSTTPLPSQHCCPDIIDTLLADSQVCCLLSSSLAVVAAAAFSSGSSLPILQAHLPEHHRWASTAEELCLSIAPLQPVPRCNCGLPDRVHVQVAAVARSLSTWGNEGDPVSCMRTAMWVGAAAGPVGMHFIHCSGFRFFNAALDDPSFSSSSVLRLSASNHYDSPGSWPT